MTLCISQRLNGQGSTGRGTSHRKAHEASGHDFSRAEKGLNNEGF